MTVFGAERAGAIGLWPGDRGFLGKTHDRSTGLTHVDAREYDAALGRFISVDPLLEPGKHQSLNGYGYAENNPVTLSDPSGLGSFSCTMGVDCSAAVVKVESTVSPPLYGASSTGHSGTAWNSPLGFTGSSASPLLPSPPPLLMGPDPIELQYTGPMSPAQKMQALKRYLDSIPVQSGSLVHNDHGGDGKVKSDGPWTLAFRWWWGSRGLNPTNTISDVSYDGDDKMTQMVIKSTGMKDVREEVAKQYNETGKMSGNDKYSVTKNRDGSAKSKIQMAGAYVSDFGGLLIGKEDREVQGVLGSYDVEYKIVKSKGHELTVEYAVKTAINNESFVPGHDKSQKKYNNYPQYMGGAFAGYRVDIRWSETIYK